MKPPDPSLQQLFVHTDRKNAEVIKTHAFNQPQPSFRFPQTLLMRQLNLKVVIQHLMKYF